MSEILYKYRGIQNFRFFVDIILNNRLYAARYSELNDPMEGQYSGEVSDKIADVLSTNKGNCRICSLSKGNNISLLWAHYAEGHRGVAIGVKVAPEYTIENVKYSGIKKYTTADDIHEDTDHEEILLHKLKTWRYEKEKRIFNYTGVFVKVEVKQVITGLWMPNSDYEFIYSLVKKINPEIEIIKASSIQIVKPIRNLSH